MKVEVVAIDKLMLVIKAETPSDQFVLRHFSSNFVFRSGSSYLGGHGLTSISISTTEEIPADHRSRELAEAALKLCEWVPDCSKGSSGDLRKQRVIELAKKILE